MRWWFRRRPPADLPPAAFRVKVQTADGAHMVILSDSEFRWALECAPVWARMPWTPTGRDGWTTVKNTGRIMVQVKGVEQ